MILEFYDKYPEKNFVEIKSLGTTGDCRWTLSNNGVLIISGNGKMGDHDNYSAPWGTDITQVIIKDGVTSIGNSAFYDCTSLTSITIPDSVTSIGALAFSCCEELASVEIPDSVTSIGDYAFYDCTSLTSITIPNSVTSIGWSAFSDCTGLTSVIIGNSVTNIGNGAFKCCTGLTSMTIPDSVTSIGDYAFYGCEGLRCIDLSELNSVPTLGFKSFDNTTCVFIFRDQEQLYKFASDSNWSADSNRFQIKPQKLKDCVTKSMLKINTDDVYDN